MQLLQNLDLSGLDNALARLSTLGNQLAEGIPGVRASFLEARQSVRDEVALIPIGFRQTPSAKVFLMEKGVPGFLL